MLKNGLISRKGIIMNKKEINKIIMVMSNLKGEKLHQISRGGSMASLGFGEISNAKVAYKTENGKLDLRETVTSKFAVHIDGFFRITHQGKIVLSKDDMFRPNSQVQNNDFDDDDFEWDAEGNNKFDEQKNSLNDIDLLVKDIIINEIGDLKIVLSNDFCIEVFIDTNEDEECWRFFEVGNSEKPHIVITGCEYYEE